MSMNDAQTWLGQYFSVLWIWGAYLLVFTALEWVYPAERAQPVRNRVFNLHYLLWSQALMLMLVPPLTVLIVGGLKTEYPHAFGWVHDLSTAYLMWFTLVYYLAFDLLYYGFHRLQHTWPLLWRQHELHHSDRSLNATTAARHHWLEEPLRVFTMALPLALLFDAPPQIIGLASILFGAWGFFIHANLRLRLGPLSSVICGPQVHRIHHSLLPQHRDKNFAAFFPIWDRIFGTWCAPQANEFPPTGMHDVEHQTIGHALFSPFGYRGKAHSDAKASRDSESIADAGSPRLHPKLDDLGGSE